MSMYKQISLLALALMGFTAVAQEAVMDSLNERNVKLQDGTNVRLFPKVGDKSTWYYLPANFRLATRSDGTPHFLFLKYVTEQRESAGGASGAILSCMFQYNLSAQQEEELKSKLNTTPYSFKSVAPFRPIGRSGAGIGGGGEEEESNGGVIHGPAIMPLFQGAVKLVPAPVTTEGPGSFQIVSAVLNDKTMTKSLACSGRAPTFPGERMAISANLGPIGAQLFAAPIERRMAQSDLICEVNYTFYTLSPAVDATLEIDMTKLDDSTQTIQRSFRKLYGTQREKKYFLGVKVSDRTERVQVGESYEEMYEDMQILKDLGVIKCTIRNQVDTELAQKITEGFLQMFMTLISQPMNQDQKSDRAKNEEEAKKPLAEPGRDQEYSSAGATYRVKIDKTFKRTYHFNASVPVRKQHKVSTDLLDMYDGVKNNPRCVGSVILNDPFFTHREIKVVLDLDAKDIFEETINYATINLRKRRASGNDFLDSVTIDSKFLKENGTCASLTYARGSEQNPDAYEYQIQWSLRGGIVYPKTPVWQVGQFQGVTVAPPVRPTTIDYQWDNEAMKAKDIVRVIAQVNYWQFGKEMQSNIQPTGDQNLRTFKFFRDDGRPEYAYRLVYFHKTKGKLAGPWQSDSSGYIYASIPDDVLENQDFKARAEKIVDGVVEKVLDQLGKAAAGIGGGPK